MVFWKFYDSTYRLFVTLGNLYAEGEKRMKEASAYKKESGEKVGNSGSEVDISDFEDGLESNETKVYFKGDVYDVNLDEIKEIPPTQDPEMYVENNKSEYLEYAYKRYRKFVEDNKEYIGMFMYGNKIFGADKNIVREGLNECLEYFIEQERYEDASEVRDLLEDIESNAHE